MRFRKQAKSGNSARSRELVPVCFADGAKPKILDHLSKETAQFRQVTKGFRTAALGVDNPLSSIHRLVPKLLLSVTTFGTELARLRDRLAAVQAEFRFSCWSSYRSTRGWP